MASGAFRALALAGAVGALVSALCGPSLAWASDKADCDACNRQCNGRFEPDKRTCEKQAFPPSCAKQIRAQEEQCWLHCVGEKPMRCHTPDLKPPPDPLAAFTGKHRRLQLGRDDLSYVDGRILAVQHHSQSTESWCWAASIAMVAQYLRHEPIDDCHVASKLDRANGGGGQCCDQAGELIETHCNQGRNLQDMTEVMNSFFNLKATPIHRALSWEDLRHSLDGGFPVLAGLFWREGAHAVVLVGYREPNLVYVDDPWEANLTEPKVVQYKDWAEGPGRVWRASFYFPQDEIAGILLGGAPRHPPPSAEKRRGGHEPPLAAVTANWPQLKSGSVREFVEAQVAKNIDETRGCYEDGLGEPGPEPSPATVRLRFSVEHGAPAWIMTKDAGGLPSKAVGCISDAVSRWAGLFPESGDFDETQILELRFERLGPASAAAAK